VENERGVVEEGGMSEARQAFHATYDPLNEPCNNPSLLWGSFLYGLAEEP
jgi:hypothetical protein